jgi:hypothetical protein
MSACSLVGFRFSNRKSKEAPRLVRSSDGAVIKVFDGTGWMSEKKKK